MNALKQLYEPTHCRRTLAPVWHTGPRLIRKMCKQNVQTKPVNKPATFINIKLVK